MSLSAGDVRGRSGRRQHEHAVLIRLRADGNAGVGGDGRQHHLRAPVKQVVVGVDGLLRVCLVVLRVQLILLTAQRVQLVDSDLRAVGDGRAVNGGGAGQRAISPILIAPSAIAIDALIVITAATAAASIFFIIQFPLYRM